MENLRQNVAVREIDAITEVGFRSAHEEAEPKVDQFSDGIVGSLALAWDHRRTLTRVGLWAVILSTAVAFLIPNRYESSVRIMPPDSTNNVSAVLGALTGKASSNSDLAMMAGSLLGMKSSGALYVNLFRSRSVQDRVIDEVNLQKVYSMRYKQDARKKLDGRTEVGEDRKSGIITLVAEDHDPQRAHDIAQAYVDELNRVVAQVSTSSARRERMFIEQRLVSVKSDLEDAERKFSAFASKNTTLDIKEQTKAMVESAAVLQGQLIAAESELQGLQQIYADNNVRVRALRARIGELRRALTEIHGSDASITSDSSSPDELSPSIRKLPLLGVEWTDLYRRLKLQETVYALLNQQYELARIQEAKEIPTVNVVDPANVPEKKSFPPRLWITFLLTSLSMAAAVTWISWTTRLDEYEPQDPRRLFIVKSGAAVATVVNRVERHAFVLNLRRVWQRGPTKHDEI